ncbi:RagB/SusD family nutrient uptake outer membrane protein [Chryseolinea soli]|uniref:RagB/SusD family nutrient uptake outer membrane protein n=1 Tax=Chryseolinea soli TaxID=2321403 RepID=A0A385SWC8_9BACT|nr:RagB/SusD family nutrient uptake outer membrane protein [Chryseolinea soli]AYB34856.1 RagB/SusD family nutrient uptake outer membrane protein [Chryseolinea soli]
MKILTLKIAAGLTGLLLLSGCESWLDESPKSALTQSNFYQNSEHAEVAVNAIYAFTTSPFVGAGTYGETPFAMMEMATGHFLTKIGQAQYAIESGNLDVKPESPYVLSWWQSSFQGIEAANLALDHIPGISMDEMRKKQLLGEAHFFRAYYYFNLVRMFGDVPMKTTSTVAPNDGQIPKSPVADIYSNVIVPDLLAAEQAGLSNVAVGQRVSLGAVKSLLAKVYLTMAGAPLNQTDKYGLARDKAKEVIDAGWYSLFQTDGDGSYFDKVNNVTYDYTGEHIFMANFATGILNAYLPAYLTPLEADITASIEFGGLYPHQTLLDTYDANDLRGQDHGYYYENLVVGANTFNFPWAIYKHFDKNIITTSPQSGKDFPIIRYPDVLLIYAEAQNQADGSPNASAYAAINSIRSRAGLADLSGLSQAAFRESVWKERVWELSSENIVWFDMVRTLKAFDTSTGTFVDLLSYKLPTSGVTYKEKNLLFPLPAREVQASSLQQNTGY